MRHVVMDFPLDMHKNAFKASEAALCAGDQGKYWEMSNKLFNNPSNIPTWLEKENIVKLAEESGLDMGVFKGCFDSGKHADEIRKRIAEGQTKAGISGTPGFLLGFIRADGTVKATKRIVGAGPFINFKTPIDEMLGSKK
jgi:protein-disulfide isomerase